MTSQKVTIKLKLGLHARPAGMFAKLAQSYQCDVKVKCDNKEFNAKSIMEVMALGAKYGSQLEIICNGQDENIALQKLVAAINSNFGGQ